MLVRWLTERSTDSRQEQEDTGREGGMGEERWRGEREGIHGCFVLTDSARVTNQDISRVTALQTDR